MDSTSKQERMVKAVQYRNRELFTPISWDFIAGNDRYIDRLFEKGAKVGEVKTEYFYVFKEGQKFTQFTLLTHDDGVAKGTTISPASVEEEDLDAYLKEHPIGDKYIKVMGIYQLPFPYATPNDEHTVKFVLKEDGIEVTCTNGRTNESVNTFWKLTEELL